MSEQELVWSAVAAWTSSKTLEFLKIRGYFGLAIGAEVWNKWAARLLAAAMTLGLHLSFDATTGVATITGLTLAGILQSVGEYAKQFMLQEIAFKKFIKKEA